MTVGLLLLPVALCGSMCCCHLRNLSQRNEIFSLCFTLLSLGFILPVTLTSSVLFLMASLWYYLTMRFSYPAPHFARVTHIASPIAVFALREQWSEQCVSPYPCVHSVCVCVCVCINVCVCVCYLRTCVCDVISCSIDLPSTINYVMCYLCMYDVIS